MAYERGTFYIDRQRGIAAGTADIPVIDDGWWVVGYRSDKHQSWERPFTVFLEANRRSDFQGPAMYVDTGEAFVHFDQAPHEFPGMSPESLFSAGTAFGLFGMPFAMPAMPAMPELRMPLPHTGRPDREFPGAYQYLDQRAREVAQRNGDPATLRCLWEGVVGEKPADADAREAQLARRLRGEYADLNGSVFTYVINKALDRTVVRVYEFVSKAGLPWFLFEGATLGGHDLLVFPSRHGITSLPGDGYPFGRAPLGNAEFYEVMWMAKRRFYGAFPQKGMNRDEWLQHFVRFGRSARFDDAVWDEMARREKAFRQRDHEEHERDIQGMRKLNAQMHEDNRRRQQRIEEDRARSWERKQELDRRNRERWSAVNRGVDQYVGPHGELVEFRQGGPGTRAYYDRLNDTVVYTDRYMPNLEELPRWKW